MSRPRVLFAVLGWLVVVVAGSALAWTVISRTGQDVLTSEQPVVATTGSGPARTTDAARPSRSDSPRATRGTASPSPSGPASPSTAAPPPSSSAPPPPVTERRTWQGPGGLVVVECRGAAVSLVAAQPDAGYAVEVDDEGPEELEVEFEGREDESGSHASIHARCVGGVPRFATEIESE